MMMLCVENALYFQLIISCVCDVIDYGDTERILFSENPEKFVACANSR